MDADMDSPVSNFLRVINFPLSRRACSPLRCATQYVVTACEQARVEQADAFDMPLWQPRHSGGSARPNCSISRLIEND
jgi:hypothetical protein